jgi:hypothetical protein
VLLNILSKYLGRVEDAVRKLEGAYINKTTLSFDMTTRHIFQVLRIFPTTSIFPTR